MYARGILFGKMKYELGDHSFVRCPENNFVADIEFKVKGYFSGTYNAIGGTIRNEKTGEVYYELSGFWTGEMFIRSPAVRPASAYPLPVTGLCLMGSFRLERKPFFSTQPMPSRRPL
jgi:Oxysterol-binding protein